MALCLLEFSLVSGKFRCKNQANLVLPFSLCLYVFLIYISFKQTLFLRLETVLETPIGQDSTGYHVSATDPKFEFVEEKQVTLNKNLLFSVRNKISWFPGILYMERS